MKKMIVIASLALGMMFTTLSKGICASCDGCPTYNYYSGEAPGAVNSLNLAGNNPFAFITSGVNAIVDDFFGPNLRESMSALLAGSIVLDSMNSGMVFFGGKLIAAGPAQIRNEFAALNLNSFGLDGQVASGSSKTWVSLTSAELTALKTDAALAGMAGF